MEMEGGITELHEYTGAVSCLKTELKRKVNSNSKSQMNNQNQLYFYSALVSNRNSYSQAVKLNKTKKKDVMSQQFNGNSS